MLAISSSGMCDVSARGACYNIKCVFFFFGRGMCDVTGDVTGMWCLQFFLIDGQEYDEHQPMDRLARLEFQVNFPLSPFFGNLASLGNLLP